jgi:hypothetical protein
MARAMTGRVRGRVMLLVAAAALVGVAGCGSFRQEGIGPHEAPRVVGGDQHGGRISAAELDELTRALADRYVGLLASACDEVKAAEPDPALRRAATTLLVDAAGNMYDIASNADAFTRLLDMVVVTRLLSLVWVEDGRARAVFGERAAPLEEAMRHARDESQTLAARVLTQKQLATLEGLIQSWRRENPGMTRASFVRFSSFAVGRGRSAASEVLEARGLFREVGAAGQAVDEARLLGERVFYQAKRMPTLLRWQMEAAKDDLLATDEVAGMLADVGRVSTAAERLPADIAREREALLGAMDSRAETLGGLVTQARDTLREARGLAESVQPAAVTLDQLARSTDDLLQRFAEYQRWNSERGARPLDIREYTEMVTRSGATAAGLNELVNSSAQLMASPSIEARMREWNELGNDRVAIMAAEGRALMDQLFRRVYWALGLLFVLLVVYKLIAILLTRLLLVQNAGTRRSPPLDK